MTLAPFDADGDERVRRQMLVADTVRGLCSGKGFLFADRGESQGWGPDPQRGREPVRMFQVNWRK